MSEKQENPQKEVMVSKGFYDTLEVLANNEGLPLSMVIDEAIATHFLWQEAKRMYDEEGIEKVLAEFGKAKQHFRADKVTLEFLSKVREYYSEGKQ